MLKRILQQNIMKRTCRVYSNDIIELPQLRSRQRIQVFVCFVVCNINEMNRRTPKRLVENVFRNSFHALPIHIRLMKFMDDTISVSVVAILWTILVAVNLYGN